MHISRQSNYRPQASDGKIWYNRRRDEPEIDGQDTVII